MEHVTKCTNKNNETIYLFPELYKIDSQKRQRIWKAEVVDIEPPEIRITHGLTDGKLVNKVQPISKGKGKNTALEQALSEARSKFNAKVNREGYQDEKPTSEEESFIPRPMLAKTFTFDSLKKKTGNIKLPAFIQAKLDGIRCFANTATGELKSRQMKPFDTLEHIAKEVKIVGKYLQEFQPNADKIWLDGEIYHHQIEFGVIQGICNSITSSKKLTDEKWATAGKLKYFVYDMYDHSQPNMGYDGRNQRLQDIFAEHKFEHLILVETREVKTAEDIKSHHQEIVHDGYEGTILRNKSGPYEPNKRSQHLQKFKDFLDEEYPIVDFIPAEKDYWETDDGELKPTVRWVLQNKDGKTFTCKMKGPKKQQHQYLLDGKKYMGALVTVVFQEYTPDGVPRFPVGKEIRDFS